MKQSIFNPDSHCAPLQLRKEILLNYQTFLAPLRSLVAHQVGLMAWSLLLPAREASGLLKLRGQLAGSVCLEGALL